MGLDPDLSFILATTMVAVLGIAGLVVLHAYRRSRRDRQRLFTWQQKQALLIRAGHRCEHKPLLGRRCRVTSRLQADHIVPWSRGGPTETWNGQVLCRRHNRSKSNLVPGPLYRWRLERQRRRYRPRPLRPTTKEIPT